MIDFQRVLRTLHRREKQNKYCYSESAARAAVPTIPARHSKLEQQRLGEAGRKSFVRSRLTTTRYERTAVNEKPGVAALFGELLRNNVEVEYENAT